MPRPSEDLTPVESSPLTAAPVFVLGMAQRTGTNFLHDLLCLHPDFVPSRIFEDYLSCYTDLLVRYAAEVSGRWNRKWGIDEGTGRDLICGHLGNGLIQFLRSMAEDDCSNDAGEPMVAADRARRLITKTPSVSSL